MSKPSSRGRRSRRGTQLSFLPPSTSFFGGSINRRCSARPLSFKKPVHLVIKSSKARGSWAFLNNRNRRGIERWLKHFAQMNHLRIYETALNWNHLHLIVRFPDRKSYLHFIRSLTGTLPRSVFGFSHPTETFWDFRPFTRIVEWGRDFAQACEYVQQNVMEAALHLRPFSRKKPDPDS